MFNAIDYLNNNYFSRSYFFTVDFTEDLDAAFLAVDFLAEVLAGDFLAVVFLAEVLDADFADADFEDARFLRFTGPAARFLANKSNASLGSIESGVYCFGKVRFVSPSVI